MVVCYCRNRGGSCRLVPHGTPMGFPLSSPSPPPCFGDVLGGTLRSFRWKASAGVVDRQPSCRSLLLLRDTDNRTRCFAVELLCMLSFLDGALVFHKLHAARSSPSSRVQKVLCHRRKASGQLRKINYQEPFILALAFAVALENKVKRDRTSGLALAFIASRGNRMNWEE